jgi:hypothetical protein
LTIASLLANDHVIEELILSHNARQKRRAILAAIFSVLGTAAAFFFFRFVCAEIAWTVFDSKAKLIPTLCAVAVVLVLYWDGFRRANSNAGLYGFDESQMFLGLDWSNAGAMLVEMELARVTGPAYVLTQLFLCGPLQLIKCKGCVASLIEPHPGLVQNLQHLLDGIVSKGKWHSVETYSNYYPELRQLISMELVEFSARKNVVKPITQPASNYEL